MAILLNHSYCYGTLLLNHVKYRIHTPKNLIKTEDLSIPIPHENCDKTNPIWGN